MTAAVEGKGQSSLPEKIECHFSTFFFFFFFFFPGLCFTKLSLPFFLSHSISASDELKDTLSVFVLYTFHSIQTLTHARTFCFSISLFRINSALSHPNTHLTHILSLPMSLPFFSLSPSHSRFKFHHSSSLTPFPLSSTTSTPTYPRMDGATSSFQRHRRKDKVVVIMGATGSGKSRLSIDLATLFPSSEIINSDKMQVYRGLDITTNKIPLHDRNGVPHHLLGDVDPSHGEFTPSDFRRRAADIISDITYRRNLPIIVGGSNSFIHALLVERFDPEVNVFDDGSSSSSLSISSELRYKCCFLWVDISFPVLSEYLLKRVDEMLDSGMVEELAEFFDPEATDQTGLRKAIGVPEFDRFFKECPPGPTEKSDDRIRKGAYEEAVKAIKDNTCQLAKRQIGKILRLKRAGWDLRRIDATDAFRAALTSGSGGGGEGLAGIWERQVLEPSVKIVKRFLME